MFLILVEKWYEVDREQQVGKYRIEILSKGDDETKVRE